MPIESASGIVATISGIILGVLGINKYYSVKINKALDKKQDIGACESYHKDIKDKFITIVDMQKEIRGDVKAVVNLFIDKQNRLGGG